jgi:MFS family permease
MDLGGRFAGTLSGTMNMMGCFGAAAFPVVTGYILETGTGHDWNVIFYISAVTYFLGMLCWIFLDPVTPLDLNPKEAKA